MSDLQRPVQTVLNGVTLGSLAAITPASKPISNTGWSQDTERPAVLLAYIILDLSSVVIYSEFTRALPLLTHLLLLTVECVGV